MFFEKALNLEEQELREQIRMLSHEQRLYYHRMERQQLKHPGTYLRLNLASPLGTHHFYLRRWGRGLFNLALTLLALALILSDFLRPYGIMLLLAVILVDIPQLWQARLLVHNYNNRVMAQCLARATQTGPSSVPSRAQGAPSIRPSSSDSPLSMDNYRRADS